MQYQYPIKTFFIVTAISMLLATTCLPVWAGDADKTEPLALRKIMQDMGENMQDITGSISREDWAMVAKIAPLIAEHPQPPLFEKMRILSFIGSDAGKFKNFDAQTHEEALVLEQAATRSDGHAVIASFATLQNSCLACHQRFRKPLVEHFYGQP